MKTICFVNPTLVLRRPIVELVRIYAEKGYKVSLMFPSKGNLDYKFHFNKQEYLIAYSCLFNLHDEESIDQLDILAIDFYRIGSHQRFYESLKRYLQLST